MGDLYSEIRERSKQDYGQKFEEWAPRILVDQYSDRTHFIFELIQNAEDAGATYVTFSLYLMPGEERYTKFLDENGVPKIRYTYCSLHGRLFNCTCKSMDEAQRLCEDWLVTQDRCYRN